MSQYPPSGSPGDPTYANSYGSMPPTPQKSPTLWIWIAGGVALLVMTPCLCCGGGIAYVSSIKEITLTNGKHNGGPPMNVSFDYAFRDEGRGPLKSYYIIVQAYNGSTRERSIGGFGFGIQHIPMRGTWSFSDSLDLGADNNKPVKVWIESEGTGGGRSTASNTLTIYPKKA